MGFYAIIPPMKIIIILLAILASSVNAKTKFRIGTWDYPPNMIITMNNGKPQFQGAIVDVWEKYIAPKADLEIVWVGPLPFPRALQMLEEGSIDAVQHLSLTPDRAKKFIFSKERIMWGKQGIIVKKSEPLKEITEVAQLKGKVIGMIAQGYLAPFFQNNKSQIIFEELSGVDSAPNNIQKLINDRIWGVYFTFPDVLIYHAAQLGKRDLIKLIPFPGSEKDEVTYAAFSQKVSPELVKKIDKVLQKANDQYQYTKLIEPYLKANKRVK